MSDVRGLESGMTHERSGVLEELLRGMLWLVPLVLIVAGLTYLALQFVTPKYTSEARLLIEDSSLPVQASGQGATGEADVAASDDLANQIQLLESPDLALRVVNKLKLASNEGFKGSFTSDLINFFMILLDLKEEPNGNRLAGILTENLEVARLEGTRVLSLSYQAENPQLAADVASAIVDEYLDLHASGKSQPITAKPSASAPQIDALRREVKAARKAIQDFRLQQSRSPDSGSLAVSQQEMADLSSKYAEAQASKVEAEAKASLIRDLLKSGGSLDEAGEVLNSPLVQQLRTRRAEIRARIAEQSVTLLSNHPQIKALKSQLGDYNRLIRDEARKIATGLEGEARVSDERSIVLRRRLDELKNSFDSSNPDAGRLSRLEREAEAKERQLNQLLDSTGGAGSSQPTEVMPANALVVAQATVPVEPSFPKVMPTVLIAALSTFLLGCVYIILRTLLLGGRLKELPRVHNPEDDVEQSAPQERRHEPELEEGRKPVRKWRRADTVSASTMPASYAYEETGGPKRLRREEDEPEVQVAAQEVAQRLRHKKNKDRSPMSDNDHPEHDDDIEAQGHDAPVADMDEVEDAPVLSSGDRPARRFAPQRQQRSRVDTDTTMSVSDEEEYTEAEVIAVVSADDDELVQVLAQDIARSSADRGFATLLLECFPDQEDDEAEPGFSDLVAGAAEIEDVIYNDADSDVHVIEAGSMRIEDDMAEDENFDMVLEAFTEIYERIVVDLGVPDVSTATLKILEGADIVHLVAQDRQHARQLRSVARSLAQHTDARIRITPLYRSA